jgi:hypothetical protein
MHLLFRDGESLADGVVEVLGTDIAEDGRGESSVLLPTRAY